MNPDKTPDIIIRSVRTIEELRVFVWENGKAQASSGYNDDLVMALGIGLWVRDTALKLYQEGINLTDFSRNYKDEPKPEYEP